MKTSALLNQMSVTILIVGFLSALPSLWYGTSITPDMIIDLEINPSRYFVRLLGSWDPTNFGARIDSSVTYLPIALFYALLHAMNFPIWFIQRVWLFLMYFLGGASFLFLVQGIFGKRISLLPRLIGTVAFMYSPYTLVYFKDTTSSLLPYFTTPLMLGLFILGLKTRNLRYALLLAIASLIEGATQPQLNLIVYFLLASFLFYYHFIIDKGHLRFKIIYVLSAIILYAMLNLWWILPNLFTIDTTITPAITLETPDVLSRHSSVLEVFRQLGNTGFYEGYQGKPYYNYAPVYISNPLLIATTVIIPSLAFAAILVKRKAKELPYFVIVALIAIPLAVGLYPNNNPFYPINRFAFDHIPFFAIFKQTSQWIMLLSLSYSILLVAFSTHLWDWLSSHTSKKFLRQVGLLILLGLLLVNGWPHVLGRTVEADQQFKEVPQYWYEFGKWTESINGDFRILLLPGQYFTVYSWGRTLGEIAPSITSKGLIFQRPVISTNSETSEVINEIYTRIERNETANIYGLLNLLGIRYLVQRNDVDYSYYGQPSPLVMENILSKSFTKVTEFGPLDVYENSFWEPNYIYTQDFSRRLKSTLIQEDTVTYSWLEDMIYLNCTVDDFVLNVRLNMLSGGGYSSVLFFSNGKYYSAQVRSDISRIQSETGQQYLNNSFKAKLGTQYDIRIIKNGIKLNFYINDTLVAEVDELGIKTGNVGISTWDTAVQVRNFVLYNATGGVLFATDFGESKYGAISERDWIVRGGKWVIRPFVENTLIEKGNNSIVLYDKVGSNKFRVSVLNGTTPFLLVLSETFDVFWTAHTLTGKELHHVVANGFANGWMVDEINPSDEIIIEHELNFIQDCARLLSVLSLITIIAILICVFSRFDAGKSREPTFESF